MQRKRRYDGEALWDDALVVELVKTLLAGFVGSYRMEAVVHASFCIPEAIFMLQLGNEKKDVFLFSAAGIAYVMEIQFPTTLYGARTQV